METPETRTADTIPATPQAPRGMSLRARLAIGVVAGVGLLFAIFLLGGLRPGVQIPLQPGEQRVDATKRYDVAGVSVFGPTGHWILRAPDPADPNALIFARDFDDPAAAARTPQASHSAIIDIHVYAARSPIGDVQQYLELWVKRDDVANNGGRFSLISTSSKPDRLNGAECRRYERSVVDTGTPLFPGVRFSFVEHGVLCVHPTQPQIVQYDYSERFLEGQPAYGTDVSDVVLGGIQFTDKPLASEPVRTTAPAPSVAVGRTVFTSAMSSASDGPAEVSSPPIHRRYGSDGLQVGLDVVGSYRVRTNDLSARDVRVEADVVFHRASSSTLRLMPNAGVICRALPDGNGRAEYFFEIFVDGGYSISRVAGARAENWTTLAASGDRKSSAITSTGTNHIQADCVGAGPVTLVLTVNGQLLTTAVDVSTSAITASSSGAGVEIDTGDEAGFTAAFRNLTVKELSLR